MASSSCTSKPAMILFLAIFCFCSSSHILVSCNDFKNNLTISVNDFTTSITSTIKNVKKIKKFVANFSPHSECLELLDGSAEELGWTLEAFLNPSGLKVGSGDLSSDVGTWLTSVLVNQDSCKEAMFDDLQTNKHGHNNIQIQILFKKSLNNIASSVTNTLGMVRQATIFPNTTQLHPIRRHKMMRYTKQSAAAVVALDGSGNFKSINDAVNAAPDRSLKPFVIYVKAGVYREYVEIKNNKWNIVMIGDGMDYTIITGSRNSAEGVKTFNSATFSVKGQGFIAQDMTFENTAGPEKHQAVAFFSDSDLSVLYRCGIRGYQDSLYANKNRQFYKRCHITGTVDFIFGRASAVFQDCQIVARKGLEGQKNTITAQGRKCLKEFSAFSLQGCSITASPEAVFSCTETYLGRPWKLYSTTVIMESDITSAISPEGWLPWAGSYALHTLYYGEYMNSGEGADLHYRVKWPGFHAITDPEVVEAYTVAKLIAGNSWLPSTGIEYRPGL